MITVGGQERIRLERPPEAPVSTRVAHVSTTTDDVDAASDRALSRLHGLRILAASRIALGLLFLWAFADKLIGLQYPTPADRGWIDGGSPTDGFLSGVAVGPLQSTFDGWAGNVVVDCSFMLGLLGVGASLVTGVGLRLMAAAGTAMLLLMWTADWPLAGRDGRIEPTGATDLVVQFHLLYAFLMVVVATVAEAGSTWGFAGRWRHRLVARHRSLW